MNTTTDPGGPTPEAPEPAEAAESVTAPAARKGSRLRRVMMRPRKVLVKGHRWLSLALLVWVIVIGLTGAWLVVNHSTASWVHSDRYRSTSGDVGAQAALDAAKAEIPKDATVWGVVTPSNGRGVYQVGYEQVIDEKAETYRYGTVYVDPGSGKVNGEAIDDVGFTHWLYRGHMYLWQDHGLFNAFHPTDGWCRAIHGHEPGGIKGVACDVIPAGDDMVAWFAVAWIVVLFTGFYLWYWPGVRRWATALLIRRGRGAFAFNMSLHKVVGLVFWVPLTVVAFTGAAFAFPNMKAWYQNATPAGRGMELWTAPDSAAASGAAKGREAIDLDDFVQVLEERYPTRTIQTVMPPSDETGTYTAWETRGFDPWTREGGRGNVYVVVDQYSGKVLYDGKPSDGNTFDQAWDDWSFPLHTGDFGGTITRIIWVLVGLAPLVLAGTGVAMNLIRRSKRKKRSGRAAPAPAAGPSPGGVGLE